MSVFYKWGNEKGDPASIVCDSMDMSLADLKLAIVDQRKIKNETDYDFLVTNSQTKEAYEDDTVLLPRNTTVHVARRPLPRGEKKIWRVNRAPVSSTIPIPEVAPEADDEESRLEEVLADSNNMYGRTNWTRVWKPRGPRALAGEKLQTENRYASGIPTSMLKPASGVEADGIDLSKKVTMTEVEREAYIQGKVESVDWLNDEEVEEKVPEQMEVPSELKCPFCGELLVAAVLLPCCVVAACDECARDMLINDDHICRLCKAGAAKKEDKVSPDDLIPNLRLRRKVFEFSNKTTGRVTSSSQAEEPRPASRPNSALEEAVLATITAQDFPSPDNLPVSDTPVPPDSTVTSQLECDSATSRPSSGQSGGGPPTPGQSGGGPPTPGQSGGGPPTPGQSGGGPPTPGQSGGGPPTPLEDERISPTPTSQPISTESLSVEPPPENREETAAEDASVTSEPPVPGEEGVGSGLERQESIHTIPTLSTSVPGVIQTTYNNSYNTYYGQGPVWDGYQWVDHSAYQHDPYSVPPPGYGVYGEKVYNTEDADGRGKTFTYDERKERERWDDRDRRRGYGRRDDDRRDGYRNYDRKKDWDRGKGYRDSRDDDRYRRHRRRSEERTSKERRSEGMERNETRERRSEGKERNEARERRSEGKERNGERRKEKDEGKKSEGRDKSLKKERVSKERSISRSRERSLEEERDRRKHEYKDVDNGEEDKRDECASQVHDSSSEDIEKEVKRKKLKDLKETLKRKAEDYKEGKKAEKEKKKKSKDKDLEVKGGDRKKNKKDDESNLDAREIIERRKHRNKSDEFERDGDWHCGNEVCRFINFQNNSNCKECGERKPETPVFWDREMVRVLSTEGKRRDRSISTEKERTKKRNHNEDRESGHSEEYSEDERENFGKEHVGKPEDKTYQDFEQVLERNLSDGDDTHKKGESLLSDEFSLSEADASMESEYAPTNLATNCSPPLQARKALRTNVTSFLDDLPDDLSSDTGENLPFTTSSVSDEVTPHFTSVDTISSTDFELNSSIESSIGEEKTDLSHSPTRVQSELNEFEYSHQSNKDDKVFKKPEAKEEVKEESITYDDFDINAQDSSDLIKCVGGEEKGGPSIINEGLDRQEGDSEGSQNCLASEVKEEATSQDTDENIQETDVKKELVTHDTCDGSIDDCVENKIKQEMCEVKNNEHFDKGNNDIDEAERKFAWKDRSRTSEEFELSLEINDDDFVQTVKEEHDTSSPRWENFRFQWDKEKGKVKQKVEEISQPSSLSLEKLENIVNTTDKEDKDNTSRERSSRSSKSPKNQKVDSSLKEDSSQDEELKQDSTEKSNSHREISVRKRMQDERIRQLSTESREKDSDKEDSMNKTKVNNESGGNSDKPVNTEKVGDKGKDSRKHGKEDRRESEKKDDRFKRSSDDGKKDDEKHRNYRRRVDEEDLKSPGKNLVRADRERESGRGAKEDNRRKNDHKKSREEESSRQKREKQEIKSSNRSREEIGGQQKDDRRKPPESPHRKRDISPSRQRGDERKHIGGQRQDTFDKRRDSSNQRMDSDERRRVEEERKPHNRGLNENKNHESSRKDRYDNSHRKEEKTDRIASPSQKRDDRADKILSPSQRRVERPDRSGSPGQRRDERADTIGSPGRRKEGRSDRLVSPSLRRDERIDRIVSPSLRRDDRIVSPSLRRDDRIVSPNRRRDDRVEKIVSPNLRRDERADRIASPNQRREERSERIVKIPDRQERDHRTDRLDPVSQLSHTSERDEIKDKVNRRDVLKRDEDRREERDTDDRRDRKDERDKDDRRDKSERNIRDRDDRPGHDLERMKHKEQEHGVRNDKYRERVSERKNSRDAKEPQTEYIQKTFEGTSQKKLHHEEPRSDVIRKESKAKLAKSDSKVAEKTKGKKREVTIKSDQSMGDNLETVKVDSKKVDEKTKVKEKIKQKDQDLRQILKMKQKEKLQGGKAKTKVAIAKKKIDKKKRRHDSSSSSSSSDSSSGSSDSSSDSDSDSAEELGKIIAQDPKVLKKLIEALNKTKKSKKGKKKRLKDKKPKMDAKAKEISKQIKMITSIENKRKVVMKKDKGMTMRINTSQEDASPEPSAVIQYEQEIEKKSKKRVRSTEKTPKKITKKIRATSDTNSSDDNEDDEEVIQVNIQNSPAMRARQSKHSSRERSPSPKVRISKIKRRDSSASNASSVAHKLEKPVKKVIQESSPQPSRRPSAITDRSESQTSQDSTTTGMDTSACEELEEGEYRSASEVEEEIQAS